MAAVVAAPVLVIDQTISKAGSFTSRLTFSVMKTLLIVTHVDFWRKGAGHRSRLSAMIDFLKDKFSITVAYAGVYSAQDAKLISTEFSGISVIPLEPDRTITFKEHGVKFAQFISGKHFDIAIIEYIEMAFVLPMIPQGTMTILDTHDLVSDRISSFSKNGIQYHGVVMNEEEELDIFNCFDKILLIQEKDYKKIGELLGYDRCLLVPHAARILKRTLRSEVKNIGFIGSEYAPNVDAIRWFLENVWPMTDESLHLNIYGNVVTQLPPDTSNERVHLHGFVDDVSDVYDHCDIMINPVRCGAGLKIKNIEAMANGVPMITTSHGAIGIEDGISHSFLVANTPIDFITRILECSKSRKQLITNAHLFIESKFSPSACYQGLLESMLQFELTE